MRINIGVPQGSILGPLPFILYIHDLLTLHPNLVTYADDRAVPVNGETWSSLAQNMLVLNLNKCMYVNFGKYQNMEWNK